VVQKISQINLAYRYFGAKGLVVMAKISMVLKTVFKLLHIRKCDQNFTEYADVVAEAQRELDIIKGGRS
jgi:hypothetical protein